MPSETHVQGLWVIRAEDWGAMVTVGIFAASLCNDATVRQCDYATVRLDAAVLPYSALPRRMARIKTGCGHGEMCSGDHAVRNGGIPEASLLPTLSIQTSR